VGIVIDNGSWVGRQSSNVGVVLQSNLWWGSRKPAYCSYRRLDAAQARASGPSLRHNFA
jgi:hypothetical protein